MRTLLVEDDRMIGAAVAQALRDASYAVDWVTDGETAIEAVEAEQYDLVLLDLGLPGADGLDVLRRFKTRGLLPVIIVTARDAIDDRIEGLDLGADDYLIKPFEVRELLARMRAILRRRQGSGAAPILSNGVISLNPATHEVSHDGGNCRLTAREFALLQALLSRPGSILSRNDLERHIYGWDEEVASNAVEFLIHAIRRKIGTAAIRNVRGVGWMVDRAP